MANLQERVMVVVEQMVKGQNKIYEFNEGLKEMGIAIGENNAILDASNKNFIQGNQVVKKFTDAYDSFSGVLGMSQPVFRSVVNSQIEFNSRGARMARSLRMMTAGLHGFRMEMLGIMFFGMMMGGFFASLLRPAMEAYGVFDIFGSALLLLFLPIMEVIFPLLLGFAEWLMGLPDPLKLVIGVFTIFLVILGFFLMVLGQLVLGIGALVLAGAEIGAFFSGLFAVIVPVIAIIMGLIDIFRFWGEDTRKVVRGVLTLFAGIAGVIAVILGAPALLVAAIVAAAVTAIYVIIRYWDVIKSFFSKIGTAMWNFGKSLIMSLINGVKSMAGAVKDAILSIFPKWAREMIWNAGKFVIKMFTGGKETGGGSVEKFNDMIWRPGSDPIAISPQDTLIATKNGMPNTNSGGDIILNQNNSFTGQGNTSDTRNNLNESNRRLMEELRRILATR